MVQRYDGYGAGPFRSGSPRWFYLLRELDKGRSVNQIAAEIEVIYKTTLRMVRVASLYVTMKSSPALYGTLNYGGSLVFRWVVGDVSFRTQ